MSEWLEDIKERFVKYQTDYNLNGEDVEWLIQQAKKTELLNAEIETLQSKWEAQGLMIQKLHRENQRYKQALELIYKDTFYDSENDLVSPIHVIRKRAEKALEEEI